MPAITGCLPGPGDTVRLDALASAEYARDPFHLLLTRPPVASSLDAAEGRAAATASWVLLTGWRLNTRGEQVLICTDIPARREALVAVARPHRSRRRDHPARRAGGDGACECPGVGDGAER